MDSETLALLVTSTAPPCTRAVLLEKEHAVTVAFACLFTLKAPPPPFSELVSPAAMQSSNSEPFSNNDELELTETAPPLAAELLMNMTTLILTSAGNPVVYSNRVISVTAIAPPSPWAEQLSPQKVLSPPCRNGG